MSDAVSDLHHRSDRDRGRALPQDRRSHALYITDAGREALARGDALQRQLIAQTLGQLPGAEILALYDILGRWRDKVRELPDG